LNIKASLREKSVSNEVLHFEALGPPGPSFQKCRMVNPVFSKVLFITTKVTKAKKNC